MAHNITDRAFVWSADRGTHFRSARSTSLRPSLQMEVVQLSSFIPYNDAQFSNWAANFVAYVTANFADFGLAITDVDTLQDLKSPWDLSFAAHQEAQLAAKSATADKNTKRAAYESDIRTIAARINAYAGTTLAQREALGIVSSSFATATPDLGASDDTPLALVDIGNRLKHVLTVKNISDGEVKKAKPAGAIGCEVWRKVGAAPTGPADMQLLGVAPKSPYTIEYADEDAGKTAYYALRWINSKGEKGSWSETESATIAA
jgi:hypothetical protein